MRQGREYTHLGCIFFRLGLGFLPPICFYKGMEKSGAGHDGNGVALLRRWAGIMSGLLCCAAIMIGLPLMAADVIVLTEDYPPYNYRAEDGRIIGQSTEKVHALMKATGLDYEIRMVPWGRALTRAKSQDNVLIYSIVRSPAREAEFLWHSPIAAIHLNFYGRAEETRKVDLWSLRQGMFTAVCTKGDVACTILKDLGVPDVSVLKRADSQEVEAKIVASGRADLFIAQEEMIHTVGAVAEKYKGRFKMLMKVPGENYLYLASGKGLRPEIADAISAARAELQQSGALPTHAQ